MLAAPDVDVAEELAGVVCEMLIQVQIPQSCHLKSFAVIPTHRKRNNFKRRNDSSGADRNAPVLSGHPHTEALNRFFLKAKA